MYSKNTLSLLKFLIENQFSQKISLTFYTNGSIINDEIADLLQTFKSCKISFSVDGTYDRLHVIRWPGDYNIIKNNFKKISKFKNTKVSVIYTYSILNATYFAEDYKIIQDELTNDIVLNSLNKPLIYAARNLPIKIKTKLIDEYSNHNNIKAKDFEIAVGELQMSAHTNSLEALIKKLKMYDSYRKTDSSILFTSDVWQLTDK